jgi:hypothetical protein
MNTGEVTLECPETTEYQYENIQLSAGKAMLSGRQNVNMFSNKPFSNISNIRETDQEDD